MKQYTHQPPSQDNDFRVLSLKPAISFDAPLHCSLSKARISDSVHYEALSYVWGARTGDRRLICDGAELLITPNCELALRYLRTEWESRSLWVDSVCIDQKSTSDRNHQVKQMGEIYRMADRALIWLGESDDQTKSAFARWVNLDKSSERISNEDRNYILDVCTKPWFERVWTIQEVSLAKKCLVVCGHESISWDALVSAAENGHIRTKIGPKYSTMPSRLKNLSTRTLSRNKYYINRNLIGDPSRMLVILSKCRRENATDPRDKVFGLFAILSALGLILPAPDYSKTTATVYEELTVGYIQQCKQLGLLELVCTFGRLSEIPTWVPDFSDQKFFIGVNPTRKPPSKLVDSALLINRTPKHLPLRGKRIAQIEFRLCGSYVTYETVSNFRKLHYAGFTRYYLILPWASAMREWILFVKKANCPTGRDATHLFSWLATRDLFEQAAESGSYVGVCQMIMDIMADSETREVPMSDFRKQETLEWVPNTSDGTFLYLLFEDHTHDHEMNWVNNCLSLLCEHTLFAMSTGHIGRAPYSIEVEDIVIWFAGAHRPMVIRPAGENYILIGPAYIHGIKESDVWDDQDDVMQLEVFNLQ